MRIALVGNQNSGKTSLFNVLTGSNQHVGNFPGVTVDSKTGTIRNTDIEIIDLPGIYSLSPYTNEEIVTRDFIIKENPDLILNIVDATNIERNLYLTLQLCELNKPVILALNMMDEVIHSGNSIDILELQARLDIPCFPIVASKGNGIDELIRCITKFSQGEININPVELDLCDYSSPVHRAIHGMMVQFDDHANKYHIPSRFAATHILEGDKRVIDDLHLSDNEIDIVGHMVKEMCDETGYDCEVTMAMMRYDYIDKLCSDVVKRVRVLTKEQERSKNIDKVLTNKWAAIPIFILIMCVIFYLTFFLIGGNLQTLLDYLITDLFGNALRGAMESADFSAASISVICDGIIGGVGSVLSFLPVVVILFFFLSILEDSGYMARIAFIMDKPLRKIGLSGRSFVPMLIGFGCSVPAVMSTRTLASEKEKKLTLGIIPFMPCSAKLPIMTTLVAFLIIGHNSMLSFLIIFGIYLISISIGILLLAIIHKIKHTKATPFMMELPAYRLPTIKNTMLLMWEKAKDFLHKAFTIILVTSFVVWALSSFNYQLKFCGEGNIHGLTIEDSLLKTVSSYLRYLFIPFGVSDWQSAAAILTGLSAKEAVVSTFDILGFTETLATYPLYKMLPLFVFVLLYMPCFATFSVYVNELHSLKHGIKYMLFQTLIAYIVAMLTYGICYLFYLI